MGLESERRSGAGLSVEHHHHTHSIKTGSSPMMHRLRRKEPTPDLTEVFSNSLVP